MSDKQDSEDEMQLISQKLRLVTTIETNSNTIPEQINNTSGTSCSFADMKMTSYSVKDSLVRNLPKLNLPEKILFVVDTVKERNCTPFKLGTGAKYTPLFIIKRVVENFVYAKSTIKRSHEYAIMTLDSQSAQWICDFTNNTKTIVNYLDGIEEDILEEDQKTYDVGQLFEKIHARIPLPVVNCGAMIPSFCTRIILIYARSNCVPKFDTSQMSLDSLMENSYVFLDSLYVHEPPCSTNMCEEIYTEIGKLDKTNSCYILEVGRNAAKLHDNMAKLLAHPLQRSQQKDVSNSVYSSVTSQEIHTNV